MKRPPMSCSLTAAERRRIPVVINNFNRLTMARELADWLAKAGMQNIIFLDNASSYPPLLAYYRSCPYRVVSLPTNCGYLALWESGFHKTFRDSPYLYTDPDVLPVETCPNDFIDRFFDVLKNYPQYGKVGFGLKLDDLPEHLPSTREVRNHESEFWRRRVTDTLFDASIDTTLALYRPGAIGGHWLRAARTGGAYVCRHRPWYLDPNRLDDEERFYRANARTSTHWTQTLNGQPTASMRACADVGRLR